MFMATSPVAVEIPRPGHGNIIAEQAASLILQELHDRASPDVAVLNAQLNDMDDDLTFGLVKPENTLVAVGALRFIPDTDGLLVAAIINVAVSPNERRQGLGTKIMTVLEEESRML
jgi:ribosomal protein S18 acetylase RimI-like enzyme